MCIRSPKGIVLLEIISEEERGNTCECLERSIYGNVNDTLRSLCKFTKTWEVYGKTCQALERKGGTLTYNNVTYKIDSSELYRRF